MLVTAAVVRREFVPPVRGAPKHRELREALKSWGVGRRMDREAAPVALLVFSDFQCPFSSVDFDAALAAECAGDQDRFERFHDALFESLT